MLIWGLALGFREGSGGPLVYEGRFAFGVGVAIVPVLRAKRQLKLLVGGGHLGMGVQVVSKEDFVGIPLVAQVDMEDLFGESCWRVAVYLPLGKLGVKRLDEPA